MDGKQRKRSMTWRPPDGMTPKKLKQELQRQALRFEEEVRSGQTQNTGLRFEDFAERWLREYAERQLKIKTVDSYRRMLPRINQAIGHIRLNELRASHLNAFYVRLQEERQDGKCKAREHLTPRLKAAKLTKGLLSIQTGLSAKTIGAAFAGKNISTDSASRVAKALGCAQSELFMEAARETRLDANTIWGYHRLVSSMLTKAVKWGYIPHNPAANAEPPKLEAKEAVSLDETDARRLLELLQGEPIKYRAAITLDLLSGLRRGELLGLRWSDVDFEHETITIIQTSGYVSGKGIYVDTPKNRSSARPLKLAASAFVILREYKDWQEERRIRCGKHWQNRDDRVFTTDNGAPIHPDTLSKWFREFARKNGFPGVHIHTLRHAYASLMIAEGTPLVVVSKRLGHKQVSTTANIYAHAISSVDEKAAQVSERFADIIAAKKEE